MPAGGVLAQHRAPWGGLSLVTPVQPLGPLLTFQDPVPVPQQTCRTRPTLTIT